MNNEITNKFIIECFLCFNNSLDNNYLLQTKYLYLFPKLFYLMSNEEKKIILKIKSNIKKCYPFIPPIENIIDKNDYSIINEMINKNKNIEKQLQQNIIKIKCYYILFLYFLIKNVINFNFKKILFLFIIQEYFIIYFIKINNINYENIIEYYYKILFNKKS